MSRRFIVLKEHIPSSKREIVPSENYIKKSNSLVSRPFSLNIDENGFIEPSAIHEKPDYKIAFLGDSFVESAFCDELFRFPYLVGRIIESKGGLLVNSYNAGVSGAHTMHGINILVNKIAPLEPNIVLLCYGLIDLYAFLQYGAYWENKSYPYECVSYFDKKNTEKVDCNFGLFLDKFKMSTRLLASICKHLNIDLIFMTSANLYTTVSDDSYIRGLRNGFKEGMGIEFSEYIKLLGAVNDSIKDIAKEFGCDLIDLHNTMPKDPVYFYDDMHLNEKGSAVVADIVANTIIKDIK